MVKRIIIWTLITAFVIFIAWIVIININSNKPNYEVIEKNGETIYKIDDVMYKEVEDSNTVLMLTNKGLMIADLYPSTAPITVANFKKLVKEVFYDGITFHRVIKDFMIQGGDPTGTGNGGSSENIKGEFSINGVTNGLSHKRGILSMARAGSTPETEQTMNSASSQFFIVHKDSTYLDGSYAAFGLLIHGYDVLDSIANSQTDENDKPVSDQVIEKMILVDVYRD